MNPIKSIIFDFDGVVVDSEPLYERAETELFLSYGIQIQTVDLMDTKGLSEKMYLDIIKKRYHINAPTDELMKKGRRILKRIFSKELRYIHGFREFYQQIQTNYKTALVTSSSRNLLEWIFKFTPIRNHFSTIVTAEDVTHSKPHPEPYLNACRLLNVKPAECIVIEDSINGVNSAKNAGAMTIALKGKCTPARFENADYTVSNYSEIATLIESINQAGMSK